MIKTPNINDKNKKQSASKKLLRTKISAPTTNEKKKILPKSKTPVTSKNKVAQKKQEVKQKTKASLAIKKEPELSLKSVPLKKKARIPDKKKPTPITAPIVPRSKKALIKKKVTPNIKPVKIKEDKKLAVLAKTTKITGHPKKQSPDIYDADVNVNQHAVNIFQEYYLYFSAKNETLDSFELTTLKNYLLAITAKTPNDLKYRTFFEYLKPLGEKNNVTIPQDVFPEMRQLLGYLDSTLALQKSPSLSKFQTLLLNLITTNPLCT